MSDAATTAPVIRVIDFETTGMDEGAEVVEAAFCDLTKVGDVWIVGEPVSWLFRPSRPRSERCIISARAIPRDARHLPRRTFDRTR